MSGVNAMALVETEWKLKDVMWFSKKTARKSRWFQFESFSTSSLIFLIPFPEFHRFIILQVTRDWCWMKSRHFAARINHKFKSWMDFTIWLEIVSRQNVLSFRLLTFSAFIYSYFSIRAFWCVSRVWTFTPPKWFQSAVVQMDQFSTCLFGGCAMCYCGNVFDVDLQAAEQQNRIHKSW